MTTWDALRPSAINEFSQHGYAARMGTIARGAGLTTGAIYPRFVDKHGLWLEVVGHCADVCVDRLQQARSIQDAVAAMSGSSEWQVVLWATMRGITDPASAAIVHATVLRCEQQLFRFSDDPQVVIRRKEEKKAEQRRLRLAAQKWFGMLPGRPTANPTPFTGAYSPMWVGNGYDPYHWVGSGTITRTAIRIDDATVRR